MSDDGVACVIESFHPGMQICGICQPVLWHRIKIRITQPFGLVGIDQLFSMCYQVDVVWCIMSQSSEIERFQQSPAVVPSATPPLDGGGMEMMVYSW